MPIYEYRCGACGREFEELTLSAGAAARVRCPACAAEGAERLLSAFAVGSGSAPAPAAEAGPCGACGAAERGACAWAE